MHIATSSSSIGHLNQTEVLRGQINSTELFIWVTSYEGLKEETSLFA